jgi:hypothetical protein
MPTEPNRSTRKPVEVVLAWQAAANAKDRQRVLDLSHEDIEVGGPRGTSRGHQVLCEWLDRTGIELETQRVFGRGDTLVVEQTAAWTAMQGTFTRAFIATIFEVRGERVSKAVRFDSLAEALSASGISESDKLPT